jgi:hypothetical protein
MHVNPGFKALGTSVWTGLLALASLALRRFFWIPSSVEREDNWR